MKTKAYIFGVIYLALLILGLVQIGINAPQGPPPYDYQMAEDEAKRVNVNVDNYTISRITGTKELWFRDMPDVSFVVAISFTDDPNKCCIKYPKDLVQITKNGDVLYGKATQDGEVLDTRKHRLIHTYTNFDEQLLTGWKTNSSNDRLIDMVEQEDTYTIFVYMTVMKDFCAIRTDSPGFCFYLIDAHLPSLYFTAYYNTFLRFYGETELGEFWTQWVNYKVDLGKAHIKNMRIDVDGETDYYDEECKVDTLLLTGKGNMPFFTRKSYKTIEVSEKKRGDITFGYDTEPMIKIAKPYGKKL